MPKADTQTSLRLPTGLRDQLAKAAEANGRGLGEEIRARLEHSFHRAAPRMDEPTRELLTAIEQMAELLAEHYPAWHEDAFSSQAFATAINKFLRSYRPEGEPEPKPKTADRLFDEEATVDGVSALLVAAANHYLNVLSEARR
jgi:hypothetical protein